ncbi:MAG: MarR family winged helix-turn-helix transcriptional regulator [Marinosulfonomonas sp.]
MFDFESLHIHWINRLAVVAKRELTQRFRAAGYNVSPEEWAVLLLLWQDDGQSPGTMSARTVRDPTAMTRLVDNMVKKGFVIRKTGQVDRRQSHIFLTELGRGLQEQLVPLIQPMLHRSIQGIPPADLITTLRVLQQMNENLNRPWPDTTGVVL